MADFGHLLQESLAASGQAQIDQVIATFVEFSRK